MIDFTIILILFQIVKTFDGQFGHFIHKNELPDNLQRFLSVCG